MAAPQIAASEDFLGISKYASVPQALKAIPNWVVWKYIRKNGKDEKIPHDAKTGAWAETNDPSTWTTFEDAVAAAEKPSNGYNGPGVVIRGTPLVGGDFDGVIDDGVPESYVLNIISQLGTPYCEITPSGNGLRVFVQCPKLPPGKRKFNAKKTGVKKYGAEIYSGSELANYLTITGNRYSGDGIPVVDNLDLVYFLVSKFADFHFRRLWMGDASEYENDDSRVDLALLGLLVRTFNGDTTKALQFFNASVPGHREKWLRVNGNGELDYQKLTLAKATSGIVAPGSGDAKPSHKKSEERRVLEFHHFPTEEEKATRTAFDYVLAPIAETERNFDGWFPLGSPSLIGGSSGSGKTTFMLDLCITQRMGAPFYKHPTFGRPFLVLMLDRGELSHRRTMRRLGFKEAQVPIRVMKAVLDSEASQEIINQLEADPSNIPQILFIEGIDMLVSDPNSLPPVSAFMHEMQQIATHFHIAIIGSCGAPKTKAKENYAAKRDTVFGSAVWARKSETIVTIQYPEGDDTADGRVISTLPRNNKAETLSAVFELGRLVEAPQPQEFEKHTQPKMQTAIDFLRRELKDGPRVGKELQEKAHRTENIQRSTIYEAAKLMHVNTDAGTDGKKHLWQMTPVGESQADANGPQEAF